MRPIQRVRRNAVKFVHLAQVAQSLFAARHPRLARLPQHAAAQNRRGWWCGGDGLVVILYNLCLCHLVVKAIGRSLGRPVAFRSRPASYSSVQAVTLPVGSVPNFGNVARPHNVRIDFAPLQVVHHRHQAIAQRRA